MYVMQNDDIFLLSVTPPIYRFTGRLKVHLQGLGPADADRVARHVRHLNLRHHRPRVLLGGTPQNMLQR